MRATFGVLSLTMKDTLKQNSEPASAMVEQPTVTSKSSRGRLRIQLVWGLFSVTILPAASADDLKVKGLESSETTRHSDSRLSGLRGAKRTVADVVRFSTLPCLSTPTPGELSSAVTSYSTLA